MTPPRLARALITHMVAPRWVDPLLGDLEELFRADVRHGAAAAHVAYWRRTLSGLWHLSRWRTIERGPRTSLMTTFVKDVTAGLRVMVRQPVYAWATVVTLALAIGANTLIFSLVNVLVVKPLPIRDPDGLGWVMNNGPNAAVDRAGASLPEYAAYRDGVPAFSTLAAWHRHLATLRVDDASERIVVQEVVGDLHTVWGLSAVAGRTLSSQDERPGADRVVTLSHRFWQTRFGAAPGVVGRGIRVDGVSHTIVGVLTPPIELGNLAEIDLWRPNPVDPALASRAERGWRPVSRLAPGATVADAHAQTSAVATRLSHDFPDTNFGWTARVGTTREALGGTDTWLVLTLLATVVGLLLMLACANVMNLLIARLIGRRQELAVRTALGASRGRIVRQIVTESLLLGLAGGGLGLALAAGGLQAMHAVATEPFFQQVTIDGRVVGFAIVLALLTPLAFAVLPTIRVLGHDVRPALNETSARSVGGRASARGRSALVVVQVALAVMLLIVATLVVRSVRAIVRADVGYDPSTLLATRIDIPTWKAVDEGEGLRIRERIVERVQAIPGVQSAALTTTLPALHFPNSTAYDIVGREAATPRDRQIGGLSVASSGYFETFGLAILAGRAFTEADARQPTAVAVISRATARRGWTDPGAAIGARLRLPGVEGGADVVATIIGVCEDTANPDLDKAPAPVIVVLDQHRPTRQTHVVLRASEPVALAAALRAAIRDVDPDVPTYQLRTVAAGFADEHSSSRLLGGLFGAFALMAVLLATAGLYGVMAYAVSQRAPEIAVRIALGASGSAVAGQVVAHSLRLSAVGAAIGLGAGWGLARTMTALLYDVSASDPATYAGAAILALASAVVAAWLPMRRAAHIDPIQALRQA